MKFGAKSKIGFFLAVDSASAPLLRMLRVIVVIRLVSVADFSIALLIGMSNRLIDAMTQLGAEKLLIQDRDGNDPRFCGSIQLFLLVRGLATGLLLFLSAPAIAWWFQVEHATWALRLASLAPVIRGLINCDVWRMQRDLRYGPKATVGLTANLVALACAIPIAMWTRDYRVFVYTTLIQEGVRVVVSHAVAERPFGLSWDRAVFQKIVRFGWPLMVTALFFFATSQGDRVVVGRAYSPEWLAWYGAAANIALVGGSILAAALGQLTLPVLSRQRDNRDRLLARFRQLHLGGVVAGSTLGATLLLLGPIVATTLYGGQFAASGPLLQLLGVAQGFFLLRCVSDQAMIAAGDTRSPSIANVCRASTLAGLVLAASWGFGIAVAAWLAILGEAIALVVSHGLLVTRHGYSLRDIAWNTLPAVAAAGVLAAAAATGRLDTASAVDTTVVGVATAAAVAAAGWAAWRRLPTSPIASDSTPVAPETAAATVGLSG